MEQSLILLRIKEIPLNMAFFLIDYTRQRETFDILIVDSYKSRDKHLITMHNIYELLSILRSISALIIFKNKTQ